jgi:hypothetical protein
MERDNQGERMLYWAHHRNAASNSTARIVTAAPAPTHFASIPAVIKHLHHDSCLQNWETRETNVLIAAKWFEKVIHRLQTQARALSAGQCVP